MKKVKGPKKSYRIGSLENTEDVKDAVNIITNGGIIAIQAVGVFGLICDGSNDAALITIDNIKESGDNNKPYSTLMIFEMIAEYVDSGRIHEKIRGLFENPSAISEISGMVFHTRLPINENSHQKIPKRLKSGEKSSRNIQNLDPTGRPIENLVRAAYQNGIKFIAVTTLNAHGKPEITDLKDAIYFIKGKKDIRMLLLDNRHKHIDIKGSFTIVDMINLTVARHGFMPKELIEMMLLAELDDSSSKGEKFPHANDLLLLIETIVEKDPKKIRLMIHEIMDKGKG